ncbi:TonB-dependent receptor plug domain-containing protein, partial [Gemmatimonadota bacterium]
EAVAGVVNIITRRSATPRGSIQVEAGGYEALRAAAGMGGTWSEGTYRLEVSGTKLGGTSSASDSYAGNVEEDGWSMWSGALSARRPLLNGALDATLRGSRSRFDMDDYGGPMGDDPNSLAWKADLAGTLQWSSPAGGRWDHRVLLGGSRIHRWSADGSDDAHPDERSSSDYRGRVQTGEWHHTLDLSRHLLAFGFTATRESGSSRYEMTSMGFTYADPLAEAHMWSTSAYLQDQVRLGGMVLTIGGRADRYADYGTRPTWRVAGTGRVGPAVIRASAGSGFRVPSLYQRNSPLYGNPDLRAERTMGWEVGVALRPSGRGRVELAHYRQDVEEMIDFVTRPRSHPATPTGAAWNCSAGNSRRTISSPLTWPFRAPGPRRRARMTRASS